MIPYPSVVFKLRVHCPAHKIFKVLEIFAAAVTVKHEHIHAVKKGAFRLSRGAVTAAVLAALLIITASAVGIYHTALRVRPGFSNQARIVRTRTRTYIAGKEMVEIAFEDTAVGPGKLGRWEPSAVPEGFEKVDCADLSEPDDVLREAETSHSDVWKNADGEDFLLFYQLPNTSGSFYDPDRILEQGNVSVHGVEAWYLVYRNSSDDVHTNLYWTIPDAGVGFILSSFDLSLDELIPIAESVAACE